MRLQIGNDPPTVDTARRKMASDDHLETVRNLFDRWQEGLDEVPTDLIAPDAEMSSPLTSVRGRTYRGYDDMRQWLDDVREQFESWEYEFDEVREEGEAVLAVGTVHLQGRGSGIALDQEAGWVLRFAPDGRINRMQVFFDRAEAQAAVEADRG